MLDSPLTTVDSALEADARMAQGELRELAEAFRTETPLDAADVALRVEKILVRMRHLKLKPNFPVNHFIVDGMYARELLIPAGSFAIGEIQKRGHLSVIARGEITMLNPTGGFTRVGAPYTVISPPGIRKCGYAHQDTVWTTVHNLADFGFEDPEQATLQQLEDFIAARSPEEFLTYIQTTHRIEGKPCQLSQ